MPAKSHLKEHGLNWNEHRKLAWLFAGRSLIVVWRAFWHGLLPNSYAEQETAVSAHRQILPDYEAAEKAIKERND